MNDNCIGILNETFIQIIFFLLFPDNKNDNYIISKSHNLNILRLNFTAIKINKS
jgi:hypothetical protein